MNRKRLGQVAGAAMAVALLIVMGPETATATGGGCGGFKHTIRTKTGEFTTCIAGCQTDCKCIASETCPDAIKPYPG